MNLKRWFRFLTYEHKHGPVAFKVPGESVFRVHPSVAAKVLEANPEAPVVADRYAPLGRTERRWIWERPAKSPLAKVKPARGTG